MEVAAANSFLIFDADGSPPRSELIDADIMALAALLPDAPERYFLLAEAHKMIPVGDLVLSRARPKGIANAVALMARAYEAKAAKRGPIQVRAFSVDRFLVLDGNSTCIIATAAGWATIPAQIEPPSHQLGNVSV